MAAKLSEKQRRFCQEYLVDWNGKQAAIRAGYSPRAATQAASRMLTRANVQDELQSLSAATTDRLGVTAERVVAELARIAFFDARQLYDDDGNPLAVPQMDEDSARVVEVEVCMDPEGGETHKVRTPNKLQALAMLAKYTGVNRDGAGETINARMVFYWPHNGREPVEQA